MSFLNTLHIHPTSSVWSGKPLSHVVDALTTREVSDPLLGLLDASCIQLCPQHPTVYNDHVVDQLKAQAPHVTWMLHADVRTPRKPQGLVDLTDVGTSEAVEVYFKEVACLSRRLGASHYSLHAGKRTCDLSQLKEKHTRLQSWFEDLPVVVEGLYPFRNRMWLVDSWEEYRGLMEQGVPYVIDLSHTNIVAKREGENLPLLRDLLAHALCREIHLSFNEGHVDNHEIGAEKHAPLWAQYQDLLRTRNPTALLFSEGNLSLHERKMKAKGSV
jgi:hypothetical protein